MSVLVTRLRVPSTGSLTHFVAEPARYGTHGTPGQPGGPGGPPAAASDLHQGWSRGGKPLQIRFCLWSDEHRDVIDRRAGSEPSDSPAFFGISKRWGHGVAAAALRAGPRGLKEWASHLPSDRRRYQPVPPPHGWGQFMEELALW
jgi:hypothetical protein